MLTCARSLQLVALSPNEARALRDPQAQRARNTVRSRGLADSDSPRRPLFWFRSHPPSSDRVARRDSQARPAQAIVCSRKHPSSPSSFIRSHLVRVSFAAPTSPSYSEADNGLELVLLLSPTWSLSHPRSTSFFQARPARATVGRGTWTRAHSRSFRRRRSLRRHRPLSAVFDSLLAGPTSPS